MFGKDPYFSLKRLLVLSHYTEQAFKHSVSG